MLERLKGLHMIKEIIKEIREELRVVFFKTKWREKNKHNNTHANRIFPLDNVEVGYGTYGPLNIHSFGNKLEYLKIGNYCSIAYNVVFCLSGEHDYNKISSFPFRQISTNHKIIDVKCKGKIIIDDDVWIGMNTTILSGVHIGQGAIIGAGNVIAKDVPAYAIVINGKVVKYRFAPEIVECLLKLDYRKVYTLVGNVGAIEILDCNLDNLSLNEIMSIVGQLNSGGE